MDRTSPVRLELDSRSRSRPLPRPRLRLRPRQLVPAVIAAAAAFAAACGSSSSANPCGAGAGGAGGATVTALGCGDPDPGTLEFLDNMEDGNADILGRDGRNGRWYTYHDTTTGTINPDEGTTPAMETIPGGRCGTSTKAMRVTGSGFSDFGSGFGFNLKTVSINGVYTPAAYDASAYHGITFWARVGDMSVTSIRLGLGDQWSVPAGGHCDMTVNTGDTACYDYFGAPISDLSTVWKRYTFQFGELQQQSFGTPRPALDNATLFQVEFAIPPAASVFDIWIDDVALF